MAITLPTVKKKRIRVYTDAQKAQYTRNASINQKAYRERNPEKIKESQKIQNKKYKEYYDLQERSEE